MKQLLMDLLRARTHPLVLIALAIALVLPSVWTGWQQDDQVHRYLFLGMLVDPTTHRSPLDPFRFVDGDTTRTHELMDIGLMPWWTLPGIRLSFWRPLSALTQWLDYRLWPQNSVLMHVQSLVWFGALVFVAALLYRRFLGAAWVAGLAGLFFALDDAHGLPAGWIANRNALLAAFFGILALLAHDAWRRNHWRSGSFVGPLFLLLALLAGESALAVCGYLFGYALFLDTASRRSRALSLLPYAGVAAAWLVTYSVLGYGTWGSGFYVDPLTEPGRFLLAVVWKAPLLLADQLALPPSSVALFVSDTVLTFLWIWAIFILALLSVLLLPLLRRDRLARFWVAGMLLSIPLVCSTVPHSRLLMFAGVGAFGLLAQWIEGVHGRAGWVPAQNWWRVLARTGLVFFLIVHIPIAAALLPPNATSATFAQKYIQDPATRIAAGPELRTQDLVILNHPIVFYAHQSSTTRVLAGLPAPRHLRVLAPGTLPVHFVRPDRFTLVVRPEGGYLARPFDDVFRGPTHLFKKGDVVRLTGMTVEVTDITPDGRPAEAAFHFPVSLNDSSLRWLQWQNGGYAPLQLPLVGGGGMVAGSPLEF